MMCIINLYSTTSKDSVNNSAPIFTDEDVITIYSVVVTKDISTQRDTHYLQEVSIVTVPQVTALSNVQSTT